MISSQESRLTRPTGLNVHVAQLQAFRQRSAMLLFARLSIVADHERQPPVIHAGQGFDELAKGKTVVVTVVPGEGSPLVWRVHVHNIRRSCEGSSVTKIG